MSTTSSDLKEINDHETSLPAELISLIKRKDLDNLRTKMSWQLLNSLDKKDGHNLIRVGISTGSLTIVQFLETSLKSRNLWECDTEDEDLTPILQLAIQTDNPEMVKYVVNHYINPIVTITFKSGVITQIEHCYTSKNPEIQLILDALFDFMKACTEPNDPKADQKAITEKFHTMIKLLESLGISKRLRIEDNWKDEPLHLCMCSGNFIFSTLLLENKVGLCDCAVRNAVGEHPLQLVIENHHRSVPVELIDLCLAHNAPTDDQYYPIDYEEEQEENKIGAENETLLTHVASKGNLRIFEHLNENYDDLCQLSDWDDELNNSKACILIYAIKSHNLELVKLIIQLITEGDRKKILDLLRWRIQDITIQTSYSPRHHSYYFLHAAYYCAFDIIKYFCEVLESTDDDKVYKITDNEGNSAIDLITSLHPIALTSDCTKMQINNKSAIIGYLISKGCGFSIQRLLDKISPTQQSNQSGCKCDFTNGECFCHEDEAIKDREGTIKILSAASLLFEKARGKFVHLTVRELLNEGASLSQRDELHATPLAITLHNSNEPIFKELLSCGAIEWQDQDIRNAFFEHEHPCIKSSVHYPETTIRKINNQISFISFLVQRLSNYLEVSSLIQNTDLKSASESSEQDSEKNLAKQLIADIHRYIKEILSATIEVELNENQSFSSVYAKIESFMTALHFTEIDFQHFHTFLKKKEKISAEATSFMWKLNSKIHIKDKLNHIRGLDEDDDIEMASIDASDKKNCSEKECSNQMFNQNLEILKSFCKVPNVSNDFNAVLKIKNLLFEMFALRLPNCFSAEGLSSILLKISELNEKNLEQHAIIEQCAKDIKSIKDNFTAKSDQLNEVLSDIKSLEAKKQILKQKISGAFNNSSDNDVEMSSLENTSIPEQKIDSESAALQFTLLPGNQNSHSSHSSYVDINSNKPGGFLPSFEQTQTERTKTDLVGKNKKRTSDLAGLDIPSNIDASQSASQSSSQSFEQMNSGSGSSSKKARVGT